MMNTKNALKQKINKKNPNIFKMNLLGFDYQLSIYSLSLLLSK